MRHCPWYSLSFAPLTLPFSFSLPRSSSLFLFPSISISLVRQWSCDVAPELLANTANGHGHATLGRVAYIGYEETAQGRGRSASCAWKEHLYIAEEGVHAAWRGREPLRHNEYYRRAVF